MAGLPGDQGDRDLKLFDAVLAAMQEKFKIDAPARLCDGPLDGGGFTYLLWAGRPDVFAAIARRPPRAPVPQKDIQALPDAASRGREGSAGEVRGSDCAR